MIKFPQKDIRPLFWVCIIFLLCNTACANKVDDDEELPPDISEANSSLTIVTRNGTEDEVICYPVYLYVFSNANGKCISKQVLNDAQSNVSFTLPAGSYTIHAFAGADETKYNLPTAEVATPTTVISLKEGENHADLMAGTTHVTLEKDGSNTTTIALKRKVMQISNSVVKNLPKDLNSVSLSLEPLYKTICLNGSYGTETDGRYTLNLTKQSDGTTWKAQTESYLLPGNTTATITITINDGQSSKSYSYPSNTQMEANYKINIEGTYTADKDIILNGTVSGDSWFGTKDIIFNFDDEGGSGEEGGGETPEGEDHVSEIPKEGTDYRKCYVLQVTNATTTSATLTLMAPKEATGISKDNALATAASLGIEGIEGWRLPDRDEAEVIFNNYTNSQTGNNVLKELGGDPIGLLAYFYTDEEGIHAFKMQNTDFTPDLFTSTAAVRAVTTLKVTKQ